MILSVLLVASGGLLIFFGFRCIATSKPAANNGKHNVPLLMLGIVMLALGVAGLWYGRVV